MSALVTGASGAVGRFLLPRLVAEGRDVVAISRAAHAPSDPRVRWLVGDLDGALPPLPPLETVFSAGPLDAFARWFAHAPITGTPRVVAIGSMSIESKSDSVDAAERALVARLHAAEEMLVEAACRRGCAWTLLRPTLIYGAGVDRSLTPIARFAQRWHVFPRIAGARGLRQPVHAQDLAAACLAVSLEPCTAAKTYALGGGERLAFAVMLERVRASLPGWSMPVPIPIGAVRALAGVAGALGADALASHLPKRAAIARLSRDLVADHSAAVADFGWAPRAFHPTAAAWQAQQST